MAFDFVIVGGGSAGCVLAARLSEDPAVKVCLLEAGGPPSDPDISDPAKWPLLQGRDIDWQFATMPQAGTAGRVHAWPRGHALGGSSNLHAMAHVRGHPLDFDGWAELGCTGWAYADLMPYFMKSETSPHGPSPYHGNSGPIRLMKPKNPHPITAAYMAAAEEQGLAPTDDHDGPVMAGPTLNALTIVGGKRQSVFDAYLRPITGRTNLSIRTGCLVDRVLIGKNGKATGVISVDGTAENTVHASSAVVLCGGVMASPAILLRSGLGNANELSALGIPAIADLPGVGENLHDHLLAGGNLYRSKRPVPPTQHQHSESLLYIAGQSADPRPSMALACVTVPVVTECFQAPPMGQAYTIMYGFTHPKSRGRLRFHSRDPRAKPLADPNYLSAPEDLTTYLEALTWARDIGAASSLDDWRDKEILPGPKVNSRAELESFLAQAAFTHHHPVGTCKMGQDELAVVGPDLAVKGISGLFVMDASIIPAITTGPINAAIVAMAERASHLLLKKAPLSSDDPRLHP